MLADINLVPNLRPVARAQEEKKAARRRKDDRKVERRRETAYLPDDQPATPNHGRLDRYA
ncbi:MAG: hypothetical protein KQJ78_24375 [Deltaproteobacteria bacterium]|nr:hypothetical protein [Deltaproteobacteria bacterium]